MKNLNMYKSYLLILVLLFSLPIVFSDNSLSLALHCPQTAVQKGATFDCTLDLSTVPSQGLTDLSFRFGLPGTLVLSSVSFPTGTDVSDPSTGTYGFFVTNPITTAGTLAKVKLTLSSSASGQGTVVVNPVSATLGTGGSKVKLDSSSISIASGVYIVATTCVSSWQVGQWSTCANGVQTRTATDSNNCFPVPSDKPVESQSCTVTSSQCALSGGDAVLSTDINSDNVCIQRGKEKGATGVASFNGGTTDYVCNAIYKGVPLMVYSPTGNYYYGNNFVSKFDAYNDWTNKCGNYMATLGKNSPTTLDEAKGCIDSSTSNFGLYDNSCVVEQNQQVCTDSDAVGTSSGHDAVAYGILGNVKDETGVTHGDRCSPDGSQLTEQLCSGGTWEPETIACDSEVPGSTCVNGACVAAGNGLTISAENQREADLFNRIHDALKLHPDSVLKQISSIADIFRCFIKDGCSLAKKDYTVK